MNATIVYLKPHIENSTIIVKVVSKFPVIEIKGKKCCGVIITDGTGEIKLNAYALSISSK